MICTKTTIFGCCATGINFLLMSFLHALCCLYLLHQAMRLTWIIISGSSSKLPSSRLNIKIYINKTYIISKNVTSESALTTTILSLKNTSLRSSSILWQMTNQSRTNFNNSGQALTALSHISWDLYLSRQSFHIKGFLETAFLHISWVL